MNKISLKTTAIDQGGYFKSFDGTKLFFSVEGSGPPLIFCYGLVCSNLHWSYQMEHFRKNHTVIWFDYRGHHKSATPKNTQSYTIACFAQDLKCLMDELKIPQATILGHSMGVNVVLELYKNNSERVKAMVLANGSARNPMETFFGSNLLQYVIPAFSLANRRMPRITKTLWKRQGKSWLTQKLIAWGGFSPGLAKESDIKTYIEQFSSMDLTMTLSMMQDYEKYDALSWLHKIKCPTLIISGENDKVIPRLAQELMHQLIPGSEFELVRKGSHCPQMDIPQLINIMIERFLVRHNL